MITASRGRCGPTARTVSLPRCSSCFTRSVRRQALLPDRRGGVLVCLRTMRTDLFDFDLPAEHIALRPASPRDAARLLVVHPGAAPEWQDRGVRDLPDLLRAGDQLVVNDTKVIPVSLAGRRLGRATEARIEATLIKRLDGSRWQAFAKPAKKLSA